MATMMTGIWQRLSARRLKKCTATSVPPARSATHAGRHKRELVNLRKSLDSLAQDQLANRPQSEEDLELPELPFIVLASQAGDGDSRLQGSSEPTILHSHGSTEVGSAPNPLSSRDTMRDVSDAAHADDMDIFRTSVASYNAVPHRPFADAQPAFPRRCCHDKEGVTESPSKKRKGDKE